MVALATKVKLIELFGLMESSETIFKAGGFSAGVLNFCSVSVVALSKASSCPARGKALRRENVNTFVGMGSSLYFPWHRWHYLPVKLNACEEGAVSITEATG